MSVFCKHGQPEKHCSLCADLSLLRERAEKAEAKCLFNEEVIEQREAMLTRANAERDAARAELEKVRGQLLSTIEELERWKAGEVAALQQVATLRAELEAERRRISDASTMSIEVPKVPAGFFKVPRDQIEAAGLFGKTVALVVLEDGGDSELATILAKKENKP